MSLKPDRQVISTDISFFNNDTSSAQSTTVAVRGGVVFVSTVGSGAAMDSSVAVVTYPAEPSGKSPVGIMLNDMVNLDLTRQHINFYKDEMQTGSKCTIMDKGWVVTDWIYPGTTPAAGNTAYAAHSGYISPSRATSGQWPAIGKFLSAKNEDGFAKVSVNLPAPATLN